MARIAADPVGLVQRRASRAAPDRRSSSLRRRPSRRSRSSTAPRRPSKVVNTGVPSATASRFMVPPAEITRSANAIRLWASIACSGTMQAAHRLDLAPLRRRCAAAPPSACPAAAPAPGRRAGSRSGGRARPSGGVRTTAIGSAGSRPSSPSTAPSGSKSGQVVLLLEPLVAAQLAARAVALQPLRRDRVGHHHRPRQAAVHVVLHRGPLVVERRGAGHRATAPPPPSRRWTRGRSPRRSAVAAPSGRAPCCG